MAAPRTPDRNTHTGRRPLQCAEASARESTRGQNGRDLAAAISMDVPHMKATQSLSNDVRIVPLVNSWSAHPYLLSPLTFGLYTKHSHLAMLESFIDDPQQHLTSSNTPELRGGPFINYTG